MLKRIVRKLGLVVNSFCVLNAIFSSWNMGNIYPASLVLHLIEQTEFLGLIVVGHFFTKNVVV